MNPNEIIIECETRAIKVLPGSVLDVDGKYVPAGVYRMESIRRFVLIREFHQPVETAAESEASE